MNVTPTSIAGVYLIQMDRFEDDRGSLTKIYTEATFAPHHISTNFPEHFFSISRRGVIRGMHAQKGATVCGKLIYVPVGAVFDVVLDLRPDSATYQKFFQTELSAANHTAIYVPEGCFHGFKALMDDTHTVYFQTKMRDPDLECGIRYDSFGMDWDEASPLVSARDQNLPTLAEFVNSINHST